MHLILSADKMSRRVEGVHQNLRISDDENSSIIHRISVIGMQSFRTNWRR